MIRLLSLYALTWFWFGWINFTLCCPLPRGHLFHSSQLLHISILLTSAYSHTFSEMSSHIFVLVLLHAHIKKWTSFLLNSYTCVWGLVWNWLLSQSSHGFMYQMFKNACPLVFFCFFYFFNCELHESLTGTMKYILIGVEAV